MLFVTKVFCSDESVVVRRGAIAFMNSVAHNNPETLRKQLSGPALNALYNETKVRPELIREVMMGPFKHKIDDGLEIRKVKNTRYRNWQLAN